MKILSVKQRGLIGLKKGMGIDEIALDLSNLSGLIALDGTNGRGKSTFLENLSPYPVMPSRKGALQHQFYLKESYLDREYLFNGDRIRCLVKINGGSNYSPEGFIWINEQPKVEGKISSYKELIREIFGSQELFYNSAFCSQGSDNLNDLDPADLKNLFAEFLRLDRYVKWEQMTKDCGRILSGRLSAIEKTISGLQSQLQAYTIAPQDKIRELNQQIESYAKQAGQERTAIDTVTSQLEALKSQKTESESMVKRCADLKKNLDQVITDISKDETQSMTELNAARDKAQRIITAIKQHEEVLKDKEAIERAVSDIETLNNELTGHRTDLEKGNKVINQLTTKISELEKQRNETASKYTKEQSVYSTTINDLNISRGEHQTSLERAKGTYSTAALEAELKSLKKQTEILEQRKSDQGCPDIMARCLFVNSAYVALNTIPDIEKQIEEKKQAFQRIHDATMKQIESRNRQIIDAQAELNALKEKAKTDDSLILNQIIEQEKIRDQAADKLRALKDTIAKFERRISDLKPVAAKADQIKVAESSITSLKQQKEEATKEGLELKSKWDIRLNELRKRELETAKLIKDMEQHIDKEIDTKIRNKTLELMKLNADLETIKSNISQVEAQVKALEQEIKEVERINQEINKSVAEKAVINNQISLFLYVQYACGKDGLRALEISSVVPNIIYETNELLTHSGFGTINIITQDPDTGREIFKIIVIDDDGDEVPLELRSGGERIWPVQALRLGMTLISKQKSPYNYLTVFNDELDGPLDVENAKKFISLYPTFMKRGGFDTCFFITHKKETIAFADHVLNFHDGGITIE